MTDDNPDRRVVWVVDDNRLDAERARSVLADHYTIQLFSDGSEVLERIESAQPHLLVVDWVMPGVTGVDVCRFLRSSGAEIPILLLTAQGATEQLVEGLEAGASDYLAKPYSDAELLARVRALIRTGMLIERARTAEATVSGLLAAAPDPLLGLDPEGYVTYSNAQAQAALNLPEARIVGKPVTSLLPDLDLARLHDRGRTEPLDVRIGERVYAARAGGMHGPGSAVAVALRDVTHRRREEARRLDLYSVIAHDLRSPLSAMLLRAELILRGDRGLLTAELATDLRKMQRNIREMVAMINDFLELARYEGGGYRMERAEVDLCDVLRQTLDDFQPLAQVNRLVLSMDHPDCHAVVFGDRMRLTQAASNLVANAIKFTSAGGSVKVSVEGDEESVTARVTDTGQGIDPVSAQTLFQRYQRAPGTQKVPGTGLGLMIVREIIELHGGTVGVHSVPGEGSTFWFRLPRPEALRRTA